VHRNDIGGKIGEQKCVRPCLEGEGNSSRADHRNKGKTRRPLAKGGGGENTSNPGGGEE